MAHHDDSIIEFDSAPPERRKAARERPPWISVVAALAALAVLAAVVLVVSRANDAESARRQAASTHRLATDPTVLWTRTFPQLRSPTGLLVAPTGLVAVGSAGRSEVQLTMLDLADGRMFWEHLFDADVDGAELLVATERSVVVQVNRADGRHLTAYDTVDGSIRWTTPTERDVAFSTLPGATPIVEFAFDPEPPFAERLAFVDPDTGVRLGELDGIVAGTDWDGTWYVRSGDDLVALELGDGWAEPTSVGVAVDRTITALAVTAGSVVGIDGSGALRDLLADGDELALPLAWSGQVRTIDHVGGDQVLLTSDSRIAGITLRPSGPVADWERELSLRELLVTSDGLLVVGWAADRSVSILDASSGRQLLDPVEGLEFGPSMPLALSDGVVVPIGSDLRGYDLTGERRWTVPAGEFAVVGDRVVVDVTVDDGRSTVRAVGDRCVPDC